MSVVAEKPLAQPSEQELLARVEGDVSLNEKNALLQEAAFLQLGKQYASQSRLADLQDLVAKARKNSLGYAKSKTTRIVKILIDCMLKIEGSSEAVLNSLSESVEWATKENRTFFRQTLQIRLVALYFEQKKYPQAIKIIESLLRELKKFDDKILLVEVQLLEAKVYHSLRNLAKSRASLTSARTSANSVYTPPLTQAELDNMSGILHAEDGDYKTAYSYFYEAFEGYSSLDDVRAVLELKYLMLVKIMLNLNDDITKLLENKTVQKYSGREIDAMLEMAQAHKNRDLQEFDKVLHKYGTELSNDPFIRSHFTSLYDKLLENNIVKEIEPYSRVEISFIANKLKLDSRQIEGKLSQMILDKVFSGVIDQGNGWLIIYPASENDPTYQMGLDMIKHLSSAVDLLFEKASAIN